MHETEPILQSFPDLSTRGTMTRVVLPAFLLPLLILSGNASAQVPKAEKVPAKAATPVSPSRSGVMEVPVGQDVRRIAPDGAVITSQ